ncbi:MAG: hypothetical protein JNM84_15955, partial [Planctomycetes bacterium]|nr:hypothetical protein [Planctomycetota bacterium]
MNRRALTTAALVGAFLVLAVIAWLLQGNAENGSAVANSELARAKDEPRSTTELLAPWLESAEPEPASPRDVHGESLVRAATPLVTPESEPFVAAPDALVIEVVDPEGAPREGISLRLDPGRPVEPESP